MELVIKIGEKEKDKKNLINFYVLIDMNNEKNCLDSVISLDLDKENLDKSKELFEKIILNIDDVNVTIIEEKVKESVLMKTAYKYKKLLQNEINEIKKDIQMDAIDN